MEIKTLLPKLTTFQQDAAEQISVALGFDLFLKSALFRKMKSGTREEIFEEMEKWTKKIDAARMEKLKELWQKLG